MKRVRRLLPVVIWGASGHALVVADIVRRQGNHKIVGFLDDVTAERKGEHFGGAEVLGGREQLFPLLDRGVSQILLGFGDCRMRLQLTSYLKSLGFDLPVAVHPSAVVADDVVVGEGTVIAAGAVVNARATIGCSVIINTLASVDHECIIRDAVHIGPGAHLAGRVVVEDAVQLGIGATVVERVQIGAGAIIGAGAVVLRNVPPQVVAYGVPAKIGRIIDRAP